MMQKVFLHFEASQQLLNLAPIDAIHVSFRAESTFLLYKGNKEFVTFQDLEQNNYFLLDEKNARNFSDWCGKADETLAMFMPEVASGQLSPFRALSLFIRKNFFKLFNEYYRITTLLNKYSNAQFYYLNSGKNILFGHILRKLPVEEQKKFICLGGVLQKLNLFQLDSPPINFHGGCLRLLKDILKCIHFGPGNILQSVFKIPLKVQNPTLVFGLLYDGFDIAKKITSEGRPCLFWNLMRFKPIIRKHENLPIETALINNLKRHPWTTIDGIDFSELFIPLIRKIVQIALPECVSIYQGIKSVHNKFKIHSCFTSMPTLDSQIAFRYFSRLKIPCFQTIHGGTLGVYKYFPPMPNSFWSFDSSLSSILIVYSDWLKQEMEEYRKVLPDFTATIKCLGSPYFENIYYNHAHENHLRHIPH